MKFFRLILFVPTIFVPKIVSAHGIGQLYTLPIPLEYYLGAAGLAVALSFFLFSYFLSAPSQKISEPKVFAASWLAPIIYISRILVLLLLLLTIATGLFGTVNPILNFAPTFFWVFFILGFVILSLFVGNLWDKLNPWKTLIFVYGIKGGNREISAWVGALLVFLLYWFELASLRSIEPSLIGGLLFVYTIINLVGAYFYKNWFASGELFSVLFGLVGRLAYFKIGDDNKSLVYLPLSYRLANYVWHWPFFVVAATMLAATSFDGLQETVIWFRLLVNFGFFETGNFVFANTLALVLFLIPFAAFYFLAVGLMAKIAKNQFFQTLALQFTYSLVPIAVGYMLAHYFTLVLISVPTILGLISDPFGFGWNLFNTVHLINQSTVLGAKFVWFTQIGFVVAAHIGGTLLAHIQATKVMPEGKQVLSQYPMLFLMVVFTVGTLWLLSLPLVISN